MRVAIGLPFIVLHLAVALLLVAGAFPWLGRTGRQRLVHWWSLRLLSICGIRLRIIRPTPSTGPGLRAIADAMRPDGIGAMLVSNHISWIDIYVVHAVRPARFVAKSEIAQWPVVGYLTRRTGTVFIERGKRHAVREANYRVAQLLREGELIVMFPEGVTGDGDRVLPFHANLIQPAIDACAPIVVAGLRYLDATGRLTTDPSYAGDVSLVQSVIRTMRSGPITAELHLIDAIEAPAGSGTTSSTARAKRSPRHSASTTMPRKRSKGFRR